MNAKNYLINVHNPEEDKFKSNSFLLSTTFISTLLYSPLNSAWHIVGTHTFAEIIYYWLYLTIWGVARWRRNKYWTGCKLTNVCKVSDPLRH